ncbi:hypothetical protein O6H91_10G021500 [Diphasiastrum complanatum]|uniref:Uncharacterized protein n=1 Tax=Diphasiastrum complanatum TaxID=34168 RepID=A0ACC2CEY8_DIPCM|nr:hypothetical protein O6H91_10G021500 [Diphasiastrum complanatum]
MLLMYNVAQISPSNNCVPTLTLMDPLQEYIVLLMSDLENLVKIDNRYKWYFEVFENGSKLDIFFFALRIDTRNTTNCGCAVDIQEDFDDCGSTFFKIFTEKNEKYFEIYASISDYDVTL